MGQPNVRELMVSAPLQNVSIQYRNKSYIADSVFNLVKAAPKASILIYRRGGFLRNQAEMRAAGTRAVRSGFNATTTPIVTNEYALAKEVTDEDRRNVQYDGSPPLKPQIDAIEFCSDAIDLSRELLVANAVVAAGTGWNGEANGEDVTGLWAAGAGNTFIEDIETGIETVRSNTGIRPNTLMLSANTYVELKQESTVLARIQYVERGIVSADLIAALFDLDIVIIGDCIYNSSEEAQDGSDFTATNVWEQNAGKGSAFLFYRPSSPGLKVPAAGYTCYSPYENGARRRVTTWREPAEHIDVYESAESIGVYQTGAYLGKLFTDTILT